MALLFPQCSLPFSPLTFANKGNLHPLHAGQKRATSLKKGGQKNLTIRCETAPSPVVGEGAVPGSTIAPADYPSMKRSDFPVDFKFGGSTSALQSEGPANIGGRGPSTWDYLLTQGSHNSAALSYVHYKEDVQLLKKMGMDVYRFSISWSRILPNGKGPINKEGITFYNNLINELLANGIQPFVTLFHLDLPTALQKEYHGFLNKKIVEDFKNYCDICFRTFGDRVKFWGTINEPDVYARYGYQRELPIEDDQATFPYIVAHNIILAHATVTKHYKKQYQAIQGGKLGMSVSLIWFEPYLAASKLDKDAADRAFSYHTKLFVEPLVYGDYPFIIKSLARDRLIDFTDAEKELIKGAYDFIGINYYTSRYAKALPIDRKVPVSFDNDQHLEAEDIGPDGKPIGWKIAEDIYMAPEGLKNGLINLKENYRNPEIYITENGVVDLSRKSKLITEDGHRITFIRNHLKAVEEAMKQGVKVKSYIVWSMIDVVELGGGYDVRLGLNYTNYDDFQRTPKKSAIWFSKFLEHSPMNK